MFRTRKILIISAHAVDALTSVGGLVRSSRHQPKIHVRSDSDGKQSVASLIMIKLLRSEPAQRRAVIFLAIYSAGNSVIDKEGPRGHDFYK
jgi:hypothetical protein